MLWRLWFNSSPTCNNTTANTEYHQQTSLENQDYLDAIISIGSLWNYT